MGPKKWSDTIKNARACTSDGRTYCYVDFQQKKRIVFDIFGQVIGLYDLDNQCAPININEVNLSFTFV